MFLNDKNIDLNSFFEKNKSLPNIAVKTLVLTMGI